IVEKRFRDLRPDTFQGLLAKYGHRAIQVGRPHTTSTLLASALRLLANRGEVELRWGQATGYWSYDEVISYWALAPAVTEEMWSWTSYCTSEGLDPMDLGITG